MPGGTAGLADRRRAWRFRGHRGAACQCTAHWSGLAPPYGSLDVSDNPALASPIPFAATAARNLRALCISCPGEEEQDWVDLEWKLHCFPKLEVRVQQAAGVQVAWCMLPQPQLVHHYACPPSAGAVPGRCAT